VTDDTGVGQAARNLSESLARLMTIATMYGRDRLDTVKDSLEAERQQRTALVCSAAGLFLLLGLGSLFAGIAVILAFWSTHPAWAAALVAGVFLILAGAVAWYMSRLRRQVPSTFVWLASLVALSAQYLRAKRSDS
jgi:uncharacterized membrane protein YqjE